MNKQGTQKIETDRLILRRFAFEDAKEMFDNWASDPEVTRFLTWPAHSEVSVTSQILSDWIPHYEEGDYFNWAIELKETGELIGNISVVRLKEETSSADIGYCMGRAYWGCGIMPEALKAVRDYLFDVVGLNRIAASHDVNNPKSGRVMEKAGMRQEGVFRAAGKNNQGICDLVWHAMLKCDRGKILETDRLYLREMTEEDQEALYAVLGDQSIMQHYPYIFDEERVRDWIKRNRNRYKENGFGLWAVCLKDTDEMIGDCGLTLQNIEGEMLPEIGYHIRRDHQHKGFAKEAAGAVRDWAFENTEYPSLYSYCKYTNVGSIKTAESIGMHFEKEYPDEANGITHVSVLHRKEG